MGWRINPELIIPNPDSLGFLEMTIFTVNYAEVISLSYQFLSLTRVLDFIWFLTFYFSGIDIEHSSYLTQVSRNIPNLVSSFAPFIPELTLALTCDLSASSTKII